MRARDAELLLSYLTAPYLRIPCILEFFAQDRLGMLFNPQLQQLLTLVLRSGARCDASVLVACTAVPSRSLDLPRKRSW